MISQVASAACPDLSGLYRLPPPGRCALLDELGRHQIQPFLSPFHAEDAHGAALPADGLPGGALLRITQSGCEKVRLELCQDAACAGAIVNDWTIPGRIASSSTPNAGSAGIRWDHPIIGPEALSITHVYPSPLAVTGLLGPRVGRVAKSWALWRKRDGRLEMFTRLDYSSFHRPDTSDCLLSRASVR